MLRGIWGVAGPAGPAHSEPPGPSMATRPETAEGDGEDRRNVPDEDRRVLHLHVARRSPATSNTPTRRRRKRPPREGAEQAGTPKIQPTQGPQWTKSEPAPTNLPATPPQRSHRDVGRAGGIKYGGAPNERRRGP